MSGGPSFGIGSEQGPKMGTSSISFHLIHCTGQGCLPLLSVFWVWLRGNITPGYWSEHKIFLSYYAWKRQVQPCYVLNAFRSGQGSEVNFLSLCIWLMAGHGSAPGWINTRELLTAGEMCRRVWAEKRCASCDYLWIMRMQLLCAVQVVMCRCNVSGIKREREFQYGRRNLPRENF